MSENDLLSRKKSDPKNRSIKVTNWVNLENCVFLRYSRAATVTSYFTSN